MLEHLAIPELLMVCYHNTMSNNVSGTDNQQGSLLELPITLFDPSETTRRTPTVNEIRSYIQGAIHDGTYNDHNQRIRISQKGTEWLEILQHLFQVCGHHSWIYREGKSRDVYVLETKATFPNFSFDPRKNTTRHERAAYIRGFFDAEGGIPQNSQSRFYVQLVQKDRKKVESLKVILEEFNIYTGIIHNPSYRVDPHYWRIFVRACSWKDFIIKIGSWHPRKRRLLTERWKMI